MIGIDIAENEAIKVWPASLAFHIFISRCNFSDGLNGRLPTISLADNLSNVFVLGRFLSNFIGMPKPITNASIGIVHLRSGCHHWQKVGKQGTTKNTQP